MNKLFVNSGIRGMIKGNDYRSADMAFPIISPYIDGVEGLQGNPKLIEVHAIYIALMNNLTSENYGRG